MRIIVMYDVDLQKRNDILLSSDGQGLDNRLHQQNIVINNIACTYIAYTSCTRCLWVAHLLINNKNWLKVKYTLVDYEIQL